MYTCYLIDLDDVVFDQGTWNLIDGVKERVQQLIQTPGIHVYFFSARKDPQINQKMRDLFPGMKGVIYKPWAEAYVVIDDLLDLERSSTSL